MILELRIERDGREVGTHRFDPRAQRTVKIGRLGSAAVRLDQPDCASLQAVVHFDRGTGSATLLDMSGTRVNGREVHRVPLNDGDVIEIGATTITARFVPAIAAETPTVVVPGPPPVLEPEPERVVAFEAEPLPPPALDAPQLSAAIPRFDSLDAPPRPPRRVTRDNLSRPAVQEGPHPALPPEHPVTEVGHSLELRIYWGEVLLDVRHYVRPRRITIGESKRADIFLSTENLPLDSFPFIRFVDGEYVLGFTSDMTGELELNGEGHSLQSWRLRAAHRDRDHQGVWCLPLPFDARGVIHWGGKTFALRFVPPAQRVRSPLARFLDLPYVNTLLFSGLMHVMVLATLAVYPYDVVAMQEEAFKHTVIMTIGYPAEAFLPPPVLPEEKRPAAVRRPSSARGGGGGRDFAGQARRGGEHMEGAASIRERVRGMFGPGGRSVLGDAGGLQGVVDAIGIPNGGGGVVAGSVREIIGDGELTGGPGYGIIRDGGSIRTGPGGPGGPARLRMGRGHGPGPMTDVDITLDPPEYGDALPREVIRKVIDDQRGQIRYCYERGLESDPDLVGRVVVRFVIAATGRVARVRIASSTLDHAGVESCMRDRIRRWTFPRPAGGGTVEVKYPFVFTSQ